jgi:UDP-N-acetylmuramate dehydrogenase
MSVKPLSRKDLADVKLVRKLAASICRSIEGRCLIGEPLAKHTSFRVGGPAALYVYPANSEALASLLKLCNECSLDVFVIGYGNNLLVSDDGFPGCVIDLTEAFRKILIEGVKLTASAGAWLNDVVEKTAEHGLTGMERLAGIPGGVGGGMAMNCGAFGTFISDHLKSLRVMDYSGEANDLARDVIEFGYRTAPGLAGRIVLGAEFELEYDKPRQTLRLIEETIAERYRRNVMTLPSAGSTFRNPTGHFAARLLESVGAKGMKVGGVEVSAQHANFIVNTSGGSAADIAALIRKLRELVYKNHQIELKLELRTIGFDYEIDA